MSAQQWVTAATMNPAYQRVKELGLEHNLTELEAFGCTVISREQLNDPTLLDRSRKQILKLAEERTGVPHDLETGVHGKLDVMGTNDSQYLLYAFLETDRVFEEMVQHPLTLALIDYYLGPHNQLSSLACFVKWQNEIGYGEGLGLHDDSGLAPEPLAPDKPHVFNTNWILTDYTKDNGAFCIVPGSHKSGRHPRPGEGVKHAVPVEAAAGSVLVFHGGVWHGAFPRRNPGLRLSVNAYYCRPYYRVQENFKGRLSDEILQRNDARFRELVGYTDVWGFTDERGPVDYQSR